MIEDPAARAGLVEREVRSSSRDGTPTKVAIARRTYRTDPADLWEAVTDPERLPRWFAPVSGQLREGGRFQVQGNAGGVVERCDEPRSFSVTWEMGPTVSWLTVTLTPCEVGTVLELVHEAPVDPEFWERYGPGAVGVGWDLALLGLALHFETGEPVDLEVAAAFTFTPAGIEFVRQAAASWRDAAIAGGEDRDASHAAADRSVAFYTTDPADEPAG